MKVLLRGPVDEALLNGWKAQFPRVQFVRLDGEEIPIGDRDAEVLVGGFHLSEAMADALPNLRWVQATYTGVEGFLVAGLGTRGVRLTNFRGVSAGNIAEHVIAGMLAFARGLPELFARQQRKEWRAYGEEPATFEITRQTLGLVGLGEISRELALKAKKGFEMNVIASRRDVAKPRPDNVDAVFPAGDLKDLASASDHLVLAAALTDETRGMIDADVLGAMKSSAYLYNIGRGELVDQEALVAAIESEHIAGAMLDVTTPEPLPVDSPLWTLPNVIITAHTAGPTPHYWERGYELFLDNLGRFIRGEELRNLVDQKAGY